MWSKKTNTFHASSSGSFMYWSFSQIVLKNMKKEFIYDDQFTLKEEQHQEDQPKEAEEVVFLWSSSVTGVYLNWKCILEQIILHLIGKTAFQFFSEVTFNWLPALQA